MTTCTILNSWDTIAHALNGCDKDGDLVFLTDNRVLVENLRELPALMCIQRKANKLVPDEHAFITANIASFGDDIGKTTNRITSMFEVQSRFDKDSEEYAILEYRIKCGQLYQQNCIDKAKGIVSKPMPREWFDYHSAAKIEDDNTRELYTSILADKKVYFQRYIYPALMKEYKDFIDTFSMKVRAGMGMSLESLLSKEDPNEQEQYMINQYYKKLPVGIGDCVMNKICRRFEQEFDNYRSNIKNLPKFDYTIYKSGVGYNKVQFYAIKDLFKEYTKLTTDYMKSVKNTRLDNEEVAWMRTEFINWFKSRCESVCSDRAQLCDIIIDICYKSDSAKQFAWDVVGDVMVENVLKKNDYVVVYPTQDNRGYINYAGKKFSCTHQKIGGWIE